MNFDQRKKYYRGFEPRWTLTVLERVAGKNLNSRELESYLKDVSEIVELFPYAILAAKDREKMQNISERILDAVFTEIQ